MQTLSQEHSTGDGAALSMLEAARVVVLVGHRRPDGDVLGAQAALSSGLRALGKEVQIINPDPPGPEFDYLAADCHFGVHEGGELPPHDLVCLLDFNDPSRCGPELQHAIANAPSKKVVIDHHPPSGEPWWDAALLDFEAAATGILVYRVLLALGVELDAAAARGVFTSLVTDTGWFKYTNADEETFRVTAELLRTGVHPNDVYDAIYQRRPASEPRALAELLTRTEYRCDGRVALVDHPQDVATELAESDTLLDVLRTVAVVEVVLYVRELEHGCKLSARSKTDFDVNQFARRFGGGGHAKASGATIRMPLVEAVEALRSAIDEEFGA